MVNNYLREVNEIKNKNEVKRAIKNNYLREVKDIKYNNEIKRAIKNNDVIEEYLHVIIVISNPCLYKRRYKLAREFIERMREEENVILYIVELVYDDQKFEVTDSSNPMHLQLRVNTAPLWHKENMINLGVERLLPEDWKAFAWIDADIEIESVTWARDALKILNGSCDIIQLFSHAVDMNVKGDAMNVFASFGYQYIKGREYTRTGVLRMFHPGYAWACTRKAYEKMGGLFEISILGAGDQGMAMSLIDKADMALKEEVTHDYKNEMMRYQDKVRGMRLGYVPTVIRHYYHGDKAKRYYNERWQILVRHKYSPNEHIRRGENGVLEGTETCPKELLEEIMEYFKSRDEDQGVEEQMRELKII